MTSSFLSHARTAWQLATHRSSKASHAGRMEEFYAQQAQDYDSFRDRLLGGRRELIAELATCLPPKPILVELGAGTGRNAEFLSEHQVSWKEVHLVDLSDSLLREAHARIRRNHWENVHVHRTDATQFAMPNNTKADCVLFSYSLTMIPNWFDAIDSALRLLGPHGLLAVVDFYIPRGFPEHGEPPRTLVSRLFWQGWFSRTNVVLSGDHIPYLASHLTTISLTYDTHPLPFIPWLRAPFYRFLGRKREA